MNLESYDILVQKYLGGELSDQELKEFERELESNSELQAELALYKKVESAVKDHTLEDFNTKLHAIHKEIAGSQARYPFFRSKMFNLLAASIIVLGAVGSIILYTFYNDDSTTDVFEKYYQPYEMSLTTRNDHTALDKDLITATEFYENKEYRKAKSILEKLASKEGDNSQVLLLLGISNMELNKLKDAEQNFISVISINNPFYSQQADWYLALTYLKSNNKEDAFLQLKAIVSDTGFYQESALELLKSLN